MAFSGKRNVLIDVALRINHCRDASAFISNNVRSVRQTSQIKLFEDHPAPNFATFANQRNVAF
jgi:hypothetical protein